MADTLDLKGAPWTEAEDVVLSRLQAKYGNRWASVAEEMPGRTGQQCAQRWRHKVNPNIRKDKWTDAEDATLQELVKIHGLRWADISRHMPGRTDQQCMGRWRRHLDPAVSRDQWTTREDRRLTELRVKHGANWSAIAKTMKNRTAQQCRARWFQAHFTGHRYLDADGNLLSPRAADKAEREVDFAKAAAAAAGKTLRPNGVKAAAANHNVDAIINSKGIIKEEKPKGRGKKRKSPGAGSGSDTEDRRRSLDRTLSRDASGRFAPREDDGWTPAATPAAAAATPAPAPPALRVKAAMPPSPIRSVSLNRQVSLPPDIADLIAREAAVDDATAEAAAAEAAATAVNRDLTSKVALMRTNSAMLIGALLGSASLPPINGNGDTLATLNSGDWGALLTGEIGSVAATLDPEAAHPAAHRLACMGPAHDSFKMAIGAIAEQA